MPLKGRQTHKQEDDIASFMCICAMHRTSVGLPTTMMPSIFETTGCVQVNVLNYLQSIISCQATANPIMDSPITALIVQMLRAPQQGAFQVLLATILGLLVRHCTFIPAELADCGESFWETYNLLWCPGLNISGKAILPVHYQRHFLFKLQCCRESLSPSVGFLSTLMFLAVNGL